MHINQDIIQAAAKRLKKLQLSEAFDVHNLDSRPTAKQIEILKDASKVQIRWVVAGNQSGKSTLAARELTWILNNEHPFWARPQEWGNEPLLIIVAGQSRQMMEVELWDKKIKPFLEEDEWKQQRVGGQLVKVKNIRTGDTIVFLSHADGSEKNRKYLQGFVAHYVWMDEMPSDIKILEELIQRVASKRGLFLATFTPKVRNDRIRHFVDSAKEPLAKKYSLSKLDNPIYYGREQEEYEKLKGLSPHEIETILFGAWAYGDKSVYQFDYSTMVERPDGYSPEWRHVESSDPAISNAFGFTLWAENPNTGVWYCVKSLYLTKIKTPEKLVSTVQSLTKDVNIVKRVCDPHEVWYINTALESGLKYVCPYDKHSRKQELIKQLQSALSSGKVKFTPYATDIIEEIQQCQWGDNGKVKNSSKYHLLDAAQYFVDCMPKSLKDDDPRTFDRKLLDAHYERKRLERLRINFSKKRGRNKWLLSSNSIRRLF